MARRGFLGLHVIGCGFGECIILEFPNSAPAIIDCGDVEVAVFATGFVKHELGWDELSFLAATHPHRDHVEGMNILCGAFQGKCGGVWVFPGFYVGKVFDRFIRWVELVKPDEEIDENFVSRNVMREWRGLVDFANQEKIVPREMCEGLGVIQVGEGVEITCLLPCGLTADTFRNALSNCAPAEETLKDRAAADNLKLSPPPRANLASSALVIRWDKTNLLLCGDCELPAWKEWEKAGGKLLGEFHGLKIGHHGSDNGVFQTVLNSVGHKTCGIITPYSRGKRPLPDDEALEQYSKCCGFLRVTAKAGAVVDETRWGENAKAQLGAMCSAIAEPEGAATTLLKLVPKAGIHQNQVSLLFGKDGPSIEQHCGGATVRVV